MRRPKGVRTKKSVAKRFKITATGKVLRPRAGRRHLLQTKSAKRRRRLGKAAVLTDADAHRILQTMPWDH
jgi:large subunit ribosomal protein L35